MAKTNAPKLADVFPRAREMPLLGGKRIVIPVFTVEHVIAIEEKFGTAEAFFQKVTETGAEKTGIVAYLDLVHFLMENDDDFENGRDIAQYMPMAQFGQLKTMVMEQMAACIPTDSGAAGGGGAGGAGN